MRVLHNHEKNLCVLASSVNQLKGAVNMGKFSTFNFQELNTVAIRLSHRSSQNGRWHHTDYKKLPELSYEFKDTDKRFIKKEEELKIYRNKYWEAQLNSQFSHQEKYERELFEAVYDAINKVNEKWNKTLAKELERDFK